MPHYDDEEAVNKIMSMFRNLPCLRFDKDEFPKIEYEKPRLRTENSFYRFYDRDHDIVALEGSPLQPIIKAMYLGSKKLEYGRTSLEQWGEYFRFSQDRLELVKDKAARLYSLKSDEDISRYPHDAVKSASFEINKSKRLLEYWFDEVLCKTILGERAGATRHFLIGDPGSGKSTLIKYLINTKRRSLQQAGLVFSRFEFLKFVDNWVGEVGSNIGSDFKSYLSFIILRDLLLAICYEPVDGNAFIKRTDSCLSDWRQIANVTRSAISHVVNLDTDDDIVYSSANALATVLAGDGIKSPYLKEISHPIRVLLIRQLCQDFTLAVVFDGFDHLAFEDVQFASKRIAVLDYIHENLSSIWDFHVLSRLIRIEFHLIFVMRENTLFLHKPRVRADNFMDVRSARSQLYRVAPLDARVAIFNSVRRALSSEPASQQIVAGAASRLTYVIMRAIDAIMRILSKALGIKTSDIEIYRIFLGNIRALIVFTVNMLYWILTESVREGLVDLQKSPGVTEILEVVTGGQVLAIVKKKKYRVIEILLFHRIPWFENAICSQNNLDPMMELIQGRDRNRLGLRDNEHFTGIIDNIFNYHVAEHENDKENHCIFEKIRIVQVLSEKGPLDHPQIAQELLRRFGYVPQNLALTLVILIRTQFLIVEWTPNFPKLSASFKGLIVTKTIAKNMAYMEHVFHQTFLPRQIITKVNDDYRQKSVFAWTHRSIRNVFILLCYMKSVESNVARGRKVDSRFLITPRAVEMVCVSLKRILEEDFEDGEDADLVGGIPSDRRHDDSIAARALRNLETVIRDWRLQGFVQ